MAALHARAALALGRHAAALEALRRLPRRRAADAGRLMLDEAEALLSLHRCREAAAVAGRALRRGGGDDADLEARLRCVRGQALWRAGRVARARDEAARAAARAAVPTTRARCQELLAQLARQEGRLDEAARALAAAREVYARHDDLVGLARVTGAEAGVRRDAGRPREALALLTQRLAIARATTRLDLLALAHHDRALMLAALGRWDEARADAQAARELFHGLDDPREFTLAGVAAAQVEIAAGRPAAARATLGRARELLHQAGGEPASLGEVSLALADACLAEGAAEDAYREAGVALRAFVLARRRKGQCRARLRQAHALVALGRCGEAVRAARGAARQAEGGPRHLRSFALLTLGRALLRVDRREARAAFARSQACAGPRQAFGHLARVGVALAAGTPAAGEPLAAELSAGLEALRQWGGAGLVAVTRVDVAELAGVADEAAPALPAPAAESAEPAPPFPGIIGRCAAMRALFAEMRRVAASDVAVFVHGETGTGKERVARALHEHSRRRQRPFVAVNVSSLSDELFEAELFGHARGAFTGAVTAREGLLAQAEGGTLFLDEVADLSPRAQAKLLRLLQEGEYRRVGESELRRADVRVVSAANRDLEACVATGTFREDLLYRLNTVVLRLPPLRERGDDVLLLARHFLRAAASRAGRAAPALPADIAHQLLERAWPGNVRQLENEMRRLLTLAGGGELRIEDMSPRARQRAGPDTTASAPQLELRAAQLEFERDFVARALARHAGNRAQTAAALGITRQALLLKMQRLGLH